MKSPIEFDERYKVTQELVNDMRVLREHGLTYREIASRCNVSYHTVYYWINEQYRKLKMAKNAKIRKDEEALSRAIQQQIMRRRKRWREFPQSRIEADYWSAVNEKRSNRKTSKGRTIEQLKKEYESTKSDTSQKVF